MLNGRSPLMHSRTLLLNKAHGLTTSVERTTRKVMAIIRTVRRDAARANR